ncbi:MAG TPA: murein L,D-transpeptidase catalytic domain family protein [Thermoanaerobaculia bacterium]|nr:murein L,D-transpeptidase catalytic domain family protein [Thermoanaerobaculia bacterium]
MTRTPSTARRIRPTLLAPLFAGLIAVAGIAAVPAPADTAPAAEAAAASAEATTTTRTLRAAPTPAPRAAVAPALLDALRAAAPTLDAEVLEMALAARDRARADEGVTSPILSVIDYSLPSSERRLWVFDTDRRELLFHELVAHGKNTGDKFARHFSNDNGSLQSSLGLFKTADTYYGKNGYSLRLHGLERGVNHLALPRTIVIHGADYVSEEWVKRHGRIGRSWGCPAVRSEIARDYIDTIKGGSLVFSYYPDENWLASSTYLADYRANRGTDRIATAR